MIFSSVGLFLISNTLLCVATATRSPSQVSESLISSSGARLGEAGQKEVLVSAAGTPTSSRADDIEKRALAAVGGIGDVALATDDGIDLEGADASEATLATRAPPVSQIVASLLVKQKVFYVKEDSTRIFFEGGNADSLYITYYQKWQMVPGNPAQFGHIYRQKQWEPLNVESALNFFVAPGDLPKGGHYEPFLFSGSHDMERHPCLVFGYVDVNTPELKIVKLLYLEPARPLGQFFKFCDLVDGPTFEVKWGEKRWKVFGFPEPHLSGRYDIPPPELICPCGYTLIIESPL